MSHLSVLLTYVIILYHSIAAAQNLTNYVNPMIGTSNFGTTNPGAVVPHGMVSVSPFNVADGDNTFDKDRRWWSTPYSSDNHFLTGYSHINLSGVGCPDLGSILLMPTTGDLELDYKNYGSNYSKEEARPGYYSHVLSKYKIKTELSATRRSGISRYTFPAGTAHILLNLGLGLTNETGAMIQTISATEVEGFKVVGTFCYNVGDPRTVFFVIRFSKPANNFGVWKKMPAYDAEADWSSWHDKNKRYERFFQPIAGDSIGGYYSFTTDENEIIEARVGISYVSIENARENLDKEQSGLGFKEIVDAAASEWEHQLSKIKVEGGSSDDKTIFYTALYHILIHPNIFQDVNGDFIGMDGLIHNSGDRSRYTVFSLWDTYRNVHPFLSLVYPDIQSDMVESMIEMYREHGWLPKWELLGNETLVMEGDPSLPVITDTWLRGIRDFNIDIAYEAMKKSADSPGNENLLRKDNDEYKTLGYVPLQAEFDNSVSHALEYYIADWNLAMLARDRGKADDYKKYLERSMGYKNYYDPEHNLLRPKLADGTFLDPFDPEQGKNFAPVPGFHEGTAYTYSFYVPHDIPGLIQLMGGKNAFLQNLKKVFDEDLYDMSNEPDITYPYLFNYVKGEEWRTQELVAKLISTHFKNAPAGLPGNDDTGTMSAWLVFSMMGIYPHCPGNMSYALTAPVFDKVEIALDTNYYPKDKLVIEKSYDTKEGLYIRQIKLGNRALKDYFVDHHELLKAGRLTFYLHETH